MEMNLVLCVWIFYNVRVSYLSLSQMSVHSRALFVHFTVTPLITSPPHMWTHARLSSWQKSYRSLNRGLRLVSYVIFARYGLEEGKSVRLQV
jgi:hypothetical protein